MCKSGKKNKIQVIVRLAAAVIFIAAVVITGFLLALSSSRPAMLFGYSFVKAQPDTAGRGIIAVKEEDADTLSAGMGIAFYYYTDPFNPMPDIGHKHADRPLKNSPVFFGIMTEIRTDVTGTYWFRLFVNLSDGSGSSLQDLWIRQDFVIGCEAAAPVQLIGFVRFICSGAGVILLIIFPLFGLLLCLSVLGVRGSSLLLLERRLKSGELTVCDEDIKRFDIVSRL